MVTRTEQLEKLLTEATPGKWTKIDGYIESVHPEYADVIGSSVNNCGNNGQIILFLRNNAELLLEIVRAAETLGGTPGGYRTMHVCDENYDRLDAALGKWRSHDD